MKTISKLKSVLVLMVFAAAIFSCSDSNETDYTGVNSIYVKTSEAPVMIASDSTPLKGSLTFTRAYDQPVALEMTVKYQTEGVKDLVTIRPAVVTLPAGSRSVDFEVVSNKKEISEAVLIEISVKEPLPQNDMQVKETLRVNVKPYLTAEDLTMEQQALLEGYKNKGVDLTKWMKDFRLTDWLPTTKKEMELRGRDYVDVILFSGDAYVDHPSFRRGCHRARFGSRRLPGGDCSPTGPAR